jgi:hypothetical protein
MGKLRPFKAFQAETVHLARFLRSGQNGSYFFQSVCSANRSCFKFPDLVIAAHSDSLIAREVSRWDDGVLHLCGPNRLVSVAARQERVQHRKGLYCAKKLRVRLATSAKKRVYLHADQGVDSACPL